MKITTYELLGLVKDSKAPKKIKYGNVKLTYNEGCEDYYPYYGEGLFEYKFGNCKNFLNDEVEIIEENKKIEKIKILIDDINTEYVANDKGEKLSYSKSDLMFADRINELIDELNKLKGEK
jgi:hypothetical protein